MIAAPLPEIGHRSPVRMTWQPDYNQVRRSARHLDTSCGMNAVLPGTEVADNRETRTGMFTAVFRVAICAMTRALKQISTFSVLFVFCVVPAVFAQPDVHTIVQRSVEVNQSDWKASPGYDCLETDNNGAGTKTYEDLMILGSPYQRLVKINGAPLSPEENQQEQRKQAWTIAERRAESPQQRASRIATYQKERKRDNLLMQQMTEAFDFELEGRQQLGPYEVYVLKATPRPDYRPPNIQTKVLTGMRGTLYVDTKDFHWVKVEAEVLHPVSIMGFVAKVEPGTRFELENEPAEDGHVWLPKHFSMKARAKILFAFRHNEQEDDTYFNCHKSPSSQASTASTK